MQMQHFIEIGPLTAENIKWAIPYLSRDMRFPTICYVRPAKHTRSLIKAFASRLNIL